MGGVYHGVLSGVSWSYKVTLIRPLQGSLSNSSHLADPTQNCPPASARLSRVASSFSYTFADRSIGRACLPCNTSKSFLAKRQAAFCSDGSQLPVSQRSKLAKVAAAAEAQSVELESAETANPFPFHLDTAVLLAGFAFEAYNDVTEGIQEMSRCGTESIFINEDFVKELYQGQLRMTLESASGLPGTSLTGTSDPYVVLSVGDSTVRSVTMWRDLEPTWDDDFSIFVVDPMRQALKVQVIDENVVGSDVLLASGSVDLSGLTDGAPQILDLNLHLDHDQKDGEKDAEVGLEVAGPKLRLTARYEGFTGQTILNRTLKVKKEESEGKMGAKEFVETVSQKLISEKEGALDGKRTGFSTDLWGSHTEDETDEDVEDLNDSESGEDDDDVAVTSARGKRRSEEAPFRSGKRTDSDAGRKDSGKRLTESGESARETKAGRKDSVDGIPDGQRADSGVRRARKKKVSGFSTDLWGAHSASEREETVEDLNDSEEEDDDVMDDEDDDIDDKRAAMGKATWGAKAKAMEGARNNLLEGLSQAAEAGGRLKVPTKGRGVNRPGLLKALSAFAKCPCPCCLAELLADTPAAQTDFTEAGNGSESRPGLKHVLDVPWGERSGALWNPPKAQKEIVAEKELEREQEEVAKFFADAESAVEAWTILADSLGKPGYVKSEFEKLVFVDHEGSDTQASVWRDSARKRIVVAFRGTEQTEWKDLATDVNLMPAKFEIDGQEVQGETDEGEIILHGGFKNAYDSVRNRLRTIVREISREAGSLNFLSNGFDTRNGASASKNGAGSNGVKPKGMRAVSPSKGARGNGATAGDKWSLLVTGHSLGGALATLFAAEMAVVATRGDCALDHVAMYNFGSPRVGNHAFAAFYNSHVPDTWRLANRDDVIPTIPRMMGYRHVGNALILGDKAGSPVEAAETVSGDPDGSDSDDLLGEVSAKDFLPKLLKGEQTLLKKVVEKEMAILDALKDGSALLQHMEDFYYKALLQMVELHIGRGVDTPQVAQV